jgi:hypothetical protein
MRQNANIAVVMPALNEERAIGQVLQAIPRWVDEVVVVDNGSTDRTAAVAKEHGARVVPEPRRGYGRACLTGIAALSHLDIVVFLDADFSDHPDEMDRLVDPILRHEADMVIGSRIRGNCARGALTPQARFGNWLSCLLIRLFWRVSYTDLGPFRAIRSATLRRLNMQDQDFGWTVEMQVKAAAAAIPALEVPVSYRRRIGVSKISGTVRGVILAGSKILYTIFRAVLQPSRSKLVVSREKLCVITRYPEPGTTKTRLIPAIGAEAAAALQHAMTAHVLAVARELAAERHIVVETRFEGGDTAAMRAAFGVDFHYHPQGDGDLGERLYRCVRDSLESGAERVVIVGADVPGVDTAILKKAFEDLSDHDLVIGPATDGGYYLIGLRRDVPELFKDLPWGTEVVLQRTLDAATARELTVSLLPALADVDRPEDLSVAERSWGKARLDDALGTISVIIPTLNEADGIAAALAPLFGSFPVAEVIVVDGGSTDGTQNKALACGAKVIAAAGGRAQQMNAGAAVASGNILLFLHADTRLPVGFQKQVRQGLGLPGVVGGAFQFRLDGEAGVFHFLERLTNWRARRLQMPYGDQALFMRAQAFRSLGGFPEMPIMEDFELVRRLKQRGRICILPAPAITSARRWKKRGIIKTTTLNQIVIIGYYLGVSPQTLARWYRGWKLAPK